jgi:hypothetical protein
MRCRRCQPCPPLHQTPSLYLLPARRTTTTPSTGATVASRETHRCDASAQPPRGPNNECHRTCEPVCMSRIRVVPSESPRRRQAREQRQQLNKIIAELAASWRDRLDDPFAIEILRGVALAQSLDDAHPIDRRSRCRRWRCTRRWWWWWPFTRRPCPTRVTLSFCRTADTVTLWFDVLNQLPDVYLSLDSVRAWLTPRSASKPEASKSEILPGAGE